MQKSPNLLALGKPHSETNDNIQEREKENAGYDVDHYHLEVTFRSLMTKVAHVLQVRIEALQRVYVRMFPRVVEPRHGRGKVTGELTRKRRGLHLRSSGWTRHVRSRHRTGHRTGKDRLGRSGHPISLATGLFLRLFLYLNDRL